MMARLVPHAETTAATLARALKPASAASGNQTPMTRASTARRLLEELGVRCDETATLQDLKGFLMTSPRGAEIVTRKDLSDEERVQVYAHLVAHALLGADAPELALVARFEYLPGREPDHLPAHLAQEEAVATAVARAILDGRMEAAPRMIYCRDLGPSRGPLSHAVLQGIHRASLALYWRSRSYQRLRSLPMVTALTTRVHSLLGSAA